MTSAEQQRGLHDLLASEPLQGVLLALNDESEQACIVGGAVRNTLMGLSVTDIDIATTALPEETMRRARLAGFKPVPTGLEHGTITVVAKGQPFEVTTLRQDIATDGRRAVVQFGRDFAQDAGRRDFTINALMLSPDGALHDHVGGLADLAARRIRFIGDAGTRIKEDYLRILRFFRFHAAYGLGHADAQGLAACIAGRDGLDGLSAERVRAELMKLIMARCAVPALQSMSDAGLWQRVTGGIVQPQRLARALEFMAEAPAAQRLAAACILTRSDAQRLRLRLKLSNAEHEVLIAAAHAFEALHGSPVPEAALARRMAYNLGHGPFMLAVACEAQGLSSTDFAAFSASARTREFELSGRDVLASGMFAGPEVGQVLAKAEALWIEADFPDGKAEVGLLLAKALKDSCA